MNNKIIASEGFSGNEIGDFVFVQVVEGNQEGSFRFYTFSRNISRNNCESKTTILDNCYVPFIVDLLHRCRDRNDNYSVAVSELDFIARIDVNNEAVNCLIYSYRVNQESKTKCGEYHCTFELSLPRNKGRDPINWLSMILLPYSEKVAEAEIAEAEKEGT